MRVSSGASAFSFKFILAAILSPHVAPLDDSDPLEMGHASLFAQPNFAANFSVI